MKKLNFLNILKRVAIVTAALAVTLALAFYILIVLGANKKLQTLWVCTAMTTMNHKYLATWFIPQETIDKILEENTVDDSQFNSDLTDFQSRENPFPKPTVLEKILHYGEDGPHAPLWFDTYYAEGYAKLENGIFLKEVSGDTWKGYVMLISDPLRVKLYDTKKQFSEGQTVKSMVRDSGAIAAINGGGFKDGPNYDSNGGFPAGLIIENGELITPDIDDEKVFNMIGINNKGVLILNHCTAKWATENDIVSAVSFSPFIVVNGEGTIKNGSGGWGIAPRSAIGQRATGEFLFVVVDGRQIGWSVGCDLDVLQEILLNEKAENGAMLDGGSSTVLYYNNDYVNRPSLGHERLINNCFIVTK